MQPMQPGQPYSHLLMPPHIGSPQLPHPPPPKERERSLTPLPHPLRPKEAIDHPVHPRQIHFNYNQQAQSPPARPVSIPPTIPHPMPPQKRHISGQGSTRAEVALWQQRYFTIYSRFELIYTQIQQIHHHYTIVVQHIEQASSPEEVERARLEAKKLKQGIESTEQQLLQTMQRNREVVSQSNNWQQKYTQLELQYAQLRQSQEALTEIHQQLSLQHQALTQQHYTLTQQHLQTTKQHGELAQQLQQLTEQHQQLAIKYSQLSQQQPHSSLPQQSNINIRTSHTSNPEWQQDRLLLQQQMAMLQQELNTKTQMEQEFHAKLAHLETNILQLEQMKTQLQQDLLVEKKKTSLELDSDMVVSSGEIENKYKRETEQLRAEVQLLQQVVGEYKAKEQIQPVLFQNQIREHQNKILELNLLLQKRNRIIEQQQSLIQHSAPSSPIDTSRPNSSLTQKEAEIRRLTHELEMKEDTYVTDIKIYKSRIDQLLERNKSLTNEKQSMAARYIEQVDTLENELAKKNASLRAAREQLYEMESSQRVEQTTPRENFSLKRELVERTQELEEMRNQVSEYRRLNNQKEDTLNIKRHEINSLNRQVKELTVLKEDLDKLNKVLATKNREVVELKSEIFEGQKLQHDLQLIQQENLSLKETLKKRHKEVNEANDRIFQLEQLAKQSQLRLKQSTEKEEIEMLAQANRRKDQEIAKYRQTIDLLQTTAREIDTELTQTRALLKEANRQTQTFQQSLKGAEGRASQLEVRCKQLQEMKLVLQPQAEKLKVELHRKTEQLQELQGSIKSAIGRKTELQNENDRITAKLSQQMSRTEEWEGRCRRLQQQVEFEREKKRDLTQSKKNEAVTLKNKCVELQTQLRRKQHRIEELQQTSQNLGFRVRSFDHNLEQIQYLKQKIEEYERKLSVVNYMQFHKKYSDLEATQVFENKLIYHLQKENDELRQKHGLALASKGKTKDSTNVKQRLNDFNSRLEGLIQHRLNPQKLDEGLASRYEVERQQLMETHREEVQRLKSQMMDLGVWQGGNIRIGYATSKVLVKIEAVHREQITFYRENNRQLQERVEVLLRVNRELKQQVEKLMKSHDGEYSIAFYKQEVLSLKETNASLQKQLRKLGEELKRLREEEASTTRPLPQNYSTEVELRMSELNYKLSQVTLQSNMLEREKESIQQQLESKEAEVRKWRSMSEELRIGKEELQRRIRSQDGEWEEKMAILQNRIAFSQAQIQRLQEMLKTKNQTEGAEVLSLRARLSQITQEQRALKQNNENLLLSAQQTKRQMGRVEGQLRSAQDQINRAKGTTDMSNQRMRERQVEMQKLQSAKMDLERELRIKQGQIQQYILGQKQFQQEISRLMSQVRLLQGEIERVNEVTRHKLSEKEIQIANVKAILQSQGGQLQGLSQKDTEIRMLQLKLSELHGEVDSVVEEVNRLREIVQQQRQANEELLREKSNAVIQMEQRLRIAVAAKEQEMRELKAKWTEVEQKSSSAANSQTAQLMRLQQRVMQCEAELLRAEVQRKQWHEYRQQIEDAFNQAANESKEKDTHIRKLEMTVSQMSRDMQVSQNEANRFRQMIQNQKQNMQQMSNSINAQRIQVEQRIKTLLQTRDQQIEQLKASLGQAEHKVAQMNHSHSGENRDLMQSVNQLRSQLVSVEEERRDWVELREQMEHAYSSLHGQSELKDAMIIELEVKLNQAKQRLAISISSHEEELLGLRTRMTDYEAQLVLAENDRKEWVLVREQFDGAYAQLQAENQQLKRVIHQLQLRNSSGSVVNREEIENLKEKLTMCQKQLMRAEDEIRIQLEWRQQTEQTMIALRAENEEKESVIREIDTAAQKLSHYAQSLEEEAGVLKQTLQEMEKLKNEAQTQIDRLCEIIKAKEAQIRELIGQQQSQHGYRQAELNDLRKMLEVCEIQLSKTRQECTQLNQARLQLDQQHQRLTELIQRMQAELQEKTMEREKLLHETQYSVQLFRSILIELDILMQEEMVVRTDLVQRFQVEIGRGFEECQRWQVSTQ